MIKAIRRHPLHTVMAILLIAIGLFLMLSNDYFTWPPSLAQSANDDRVGLVYVIFGIAMGAWVFYPHQSVRIDHFILVGAAFLMGTLTIYQLLHTFVVGINMPWISNAALTAIIMVIARRSDSA